MQRKTKKTFSKIIIVLIICCAALFVAQHVHIGEIQDTPDEPITDPVNPSDEEFTPVVDEDYEAVDLNLGEFYCKDIYINGYHINNWQLYSPFIEVSGTVYVPASEAILSALGLKIEFNDETHYVRFIPTNSPSMDYVNEHWLACNLQYSEVYWGHTYGYSCKALGKIFGSKINKAFENAFVTTKDERQLYISLKALESYSGLFFTYYIHPEGGLYISTIKDVNAESFYCENNTKYIQGRAAYMLDVYPELPWETALYYEYLFRHEATINSFVDEDILIAICHTESWFYCDAHSSADAIGLMQCLLSLAEYDGYTEEMLQDPHYNIQRGAAWLQASIIECDNNPDWGLAAYEMGVGNFWTQMNSTGSYNSWYADICKNRRDMLKLFVEQNGYSNTFIEYTGNE